MRKQVIKTTTNRGSLVMQMPNRQEQEIATYSGKTVVTLTKPDVKRNPKIDGFRQPSDYFTRIEPNALDYNRMRLPGSCTFSPEGPAVNGGSNQYWGFRGSGDLFVSNADWAFPQGRPDALRTKVLNNVRGEVLDVAMVLSEIGKTASTGANLMHRIGRSMQALRSRNRPSFEYLWDGRIPRDGSGRPLTGRSLDRFNRQTASAFLEWKYGIMPTVYDLQGVTKALDMNAEGSLFNNPPLAVSRATESYTVTRNMPISIYEPGGTVSQTQCKVSDRVTHKARLDYRVEAEGMRGLNRFGLGLTSLPTIMYDRTPFSFVFNMVCPIAEIIKAWGALAGTNVVGYCETLHIERTFDTPKATSSGRYPNGITVTPIIEEFPCIYFDRKAFATPPMPLPYVRNPVKVGNVASVLALFTQLRPKRS